MSHAFSIRFDTSSLLWEELLAKLSAVMAQADFRFGGRVTPLVSHSGFPTVDVGGVHFAGGELVTNDSFEAESIPAIGHGTAGAWGISAEFTSGFMLNNLGRGTWAEVYAQVFRAGKKGDKKLTLDFSEERAAYDFRVTRSEAAQNLYSLQLSLCAQLGFGMSIYEEQDYRGGLLPYVTLEELKKRLARASRGRLGCSMVVSSDMLSLADAQALAGASGELVRLTTNGFVLFPFLVPPSG